ncbi:MAG TPA: sialidase family protein, partial [Bacteroidota bacterium]|nr:sialidase family protein [Bacteroidota bacterium]
MPHNVQVHCLVASGSTLFAGTGLGVYRSTDNGSRWIATNSGISVASGLDGLIVNALAVSGPNLFGQLYYTAVSNVDVLSWSLARPPFSAFYQMLQVGTNLFAATNEGLCVSTDNGTTWSVPDSTLWGSSVKALAVSGGSLFACNSRGVFRSTDDGMHWTQASAGLRDLSVGQLVVSSTNLVAGTWHGVFFSTNSGTNWMPAKMNSLDTNTQALAVSGPNVFASTNGGVLISTDNGANWSLANTPFSMFYQMLKIGTILFAASGADFMRSTDDGQTWIPSDTGISCAPVEFLESVRNYLIASTRVDGSFISSDKGTSWEKLNP